MRAKFILLAMATSLVIAGCGSSDTYDAPDKPAETSKKFEAGGQAGSDTSGGAPAKPQQPDAAASE